MKRNFISNFLVCSICFTLVLNEACSKKDPTPTTPTVPVTQTPSTASPQYKPKDGDGVLAAVQTVSFQTIGGYPIEVDLGLGVVVFTNNSFSTFLDGGTVNLNSTALAKQTNNSYVYTPTSSNASGIDFSSGVSWSVTGNSGNSIPAISRDISTPFPDLADIDNSGTVSTAAAFTLKTTSSISNADSTYFTVSGPKATVQKIVAGSTQQVTFTSTEMASLGTGANSGLLQIAPFNIESHTTSGKKYYYVEEKVISKIVTLQ